LNDAEAWRDKRLLLIQSFAFGWFAAFLAVAALTDRSFSNAILASLALTPIVGLAILPCWRFLRPYCRVGWFWLRGL
jgi:hypothetical protein